MFYFIFSLVRLEIMNSILTLEIRKLGQRFCISKKLLGNAHHTVQQGAGTMT
jgi:hypothetical protein